MVIILQVGIALPQIGLVGDQKVDKPIGPPWPSGSPVVLDPFEDLFDLQVTYFSRLGNE